MIQPPVFQAWYKPGEALPKPVFGYARIEVGAADERTGLVPMYVVNSEGVRLSDVGLMVEPEHLISGTELVAKVRRLIQEGKA